MSGEEADQGSPSKNTSVDMIGVGNNHYNILNKYRRDNYESFHGNPPESIGKRPFLSKLLSVVCESLTETGGKVLSNELSYEIRIAILYILNDCVEMTKNMCDTDHALKNISMRSSIQGFPKNHRISDSSNSGFLFEIADLRDDKMTLQERLVMTESKNIKLQKLLDENRIRYENTIGQIKAKMDDLNAQLVTTRARETDLKNQLENSSKQISELFDDIESISKKNFETDEKLRETEKELFIANSNIMELENLKLCKESAVNIPTNEPFLDSLTREFVSPDKELSRRIHDMELQIASQLKELEKTRETIQRNETMILNQNRTIDKCQSKLIEMTYEKNALERELELHKRDLNSTNDEKYDLDKKYEESERNRLLLENELEKVKKALNYDGDIKMMHKFIKKPLESDIVDQQRSIINGLVDFASKIINEESIPEFHPITFSVDNREKMQKSIEMALQKISDNEPIPLFDAAYGSRKAAEKIIDILSMPENSEITSVISLLAAVNKRCLSTLTLINHKFECLTQYFKSGDDIASRVLSFVINVQSPLDEIAHLMKKVFKKEVQGIESLDLFQAFMTEIRLLVTNVECGLKPLVKTECDFVDIPLLVRDIVCRMQKDNSQSHSSMSGGIDEQIQVATEEMKAITDKVNTLREENQSLISELQGRNDELQEFENTKLDLEDKLGKMTSAKDELENTNMILKSRVEAVEQRYETLKMECRCLKKSLDQRSEQFNKRVEELIKQERERHAEEIERKEVLHKQREKVLESHVNSLEQKLRTEKRRTNQIRGDVLRSKEEQSIHPTPKGKSSQNGTESDVSQIFCESPSPSKPDISLISFIGPHLDKCFKRSGDWDSAKIVRAVSTLVDRVHYLENKNKHI